MTIATIKEISKYAEKAYEMLKKDSENRYSLLEEIEYPPMDCSQWFRPFDFDNDYLEIRVVDYRRIKIKIKPFDGKRINLWDGTSLYPDSDKPVFYASLLHDILYYSMKEIYIKCDVDMNLMRAFADVCFANLCDKYGSNKLKNRLIYTVLRIGGGAYHWIKGIIGLLIFYLVLSCASCQYPQIMDEGETPVPVYEKVASA